MIQELQGRHGDLMFHQSGGCCDGSAPMCFPLGEFILGDNDVHLGDIGGVPFYISESQYEYWCHTQLIIDVVPGRGGMFSLEGPDRQALPDALALLRGRGVGRAGGQRESEGLTPHADRVAEWGHEPLGAAPAIPAIARTASQSDSRRGTAAAATS